MRQRLTVSIAGTYRRYLYRKDVKRRYIWATPMLYSRIICITLLLVAVFYGNRISASPLGEGAGAAARGDRETAIKLLRPLADGGSGPAAVILGNIYAEGDGGPKDVDLAFKWYKIAATHGDLEGENRIGQMLYEGVDVPKDTSASISWYRAAADRGYAPSQFNLGLIYGDDHSGFTDYVQGYMWLSLATIPSNQAPQGWTPAAFKERLAARMTKSQIAEALRRKESWLRSHPSLLKTSP